VVSPGPRRVLVTGGNGFVGSHVVDALLDDGREVVALDVRADHGPARPGLTRVNADVRDLEAVLGALAGVDGVSHQAAMVGLGVDLDDVADYVRHNDLGTAVLLRALHRVRFRGPLVLASSMVVYGEGGYRCAEHGSVRPGPRAEEDLSAGRFEPTCPRCRSSLAPTEVTEDAPLDPRNVYAATKLHQEHLSTVFAREHPGATVTALRYHNVYGPRMPRDTPYAGVASIFRSALARGEAPRVFEDGNQRRNFVHVADVARANTLALDAGVPGAFNIASDEPHTIGEMAAALTAATGQDALAPVVTGEYRLGDVRHVFASPARAHRELGFRAVVPFGDGMRAFAQAPLASAT
jgi:dTDP-L-rhamnose 4-epimerase